MKKFINNKLNKYISQNDILVNDLPGMHKKSFALYFNGGEIWCEHLDGMYTFTKEVMLKFIEDTPHVTKHSATSLIAVNLDDTLVTEEIITLISDTYVKNTRFIQKLVFVGLDKYSRRKFISAFKKREDEFEFVINYINDFEKAKEWLVG